MKKVKSNLPIFRKEFQFEQASVVYTADHSEATGMVMPKLAVQVIDAYGYQRELMVQFRHASGDSKILHWEMHVYRHPGRRNIQEMSQVVAENFINRFLVICEKYPLFLFNDGMPRSKGFVQLSEQLLDGAALSVKLLK
jgi:hypothetical protein